LRRQAFFIVVSVPSPIAFPIPAIKTKPPALKQGGRLMIAVGMLLFLEEHPVFQRVGNKVGECVAVED
jgi:hypothetical protein